MDNELIITAAFTGSGLLTCVIVSGILKIRKRVLAHKKW
jgi:hypothetical protein